MSSVFLFMVIASSVWLLFTDPSAILTASLNSIRNSLNLALTLCVIYIFWMALAEVATRSGLVDKIAKKLKPLLKFLFGEQTEKVNQHIATNISANLIGANGAATPAAISAIEKMSTPGQTKASPAMIMLFILAATSLQLLPTTVIGILKEHGAVNPESIILPTLITSGLVTVLGVLLVMLFVRKRGK